MLPAIVGASSASAVANPTGQGAYLDGVAGQQQRLRRGSSQTSSDDINPTTRVRSPVPGRAHCPGILVLEQARTEQLLLKAVLETGLCEVRFGAEAISLEQGSDGARLTYRQDDAEHDLDATFVAGCDGAGSFVRDAIGLPFEGFTYSIRPMIADVRIDDERNNLEWPRIWNGSDGLSAALRLPDGLWRIIRLERGDPDNKADVPEPEIADRVAETLGDGPFAVKWANRFRIHLRSAPRFRVGRVVLVGDAAHVHSPVGALGMNAGIQDAHNLAWKLATALRGGDLERLLDSYDVERRDVVVENVSTYADKLTRAFLQAPSVARAAMFLLVRLGIAFAPVHKSMLRRNTMTGFGYKKSPLLDRRDLAAGQRLPNPVLRDPDGKEVRLYDLMPNAPVVLHVGADGKPNSELPGVHVIRIGPGGY